MIQAKWCESDGELQDAFAIREAVFVSEQGFPSESEWDELDAVCDHVIVYDGALPVAAGRLYELTGGAWGFGRVCVLKAHRKQRYGDLVVRMLLNRGLKKGAALFRISAQLHAQGFYEQFGFQAVGEPFRDERVDAVMMEAAAEDVLFPRDCDGR